MLKLLAVFGRQTRTAYTGIYGVEVELINDRFLVQ
jgi:hypothetical protein